MTRLQTTTALFLLAVSSTLGHTMFRHSDTKGNDFTVSQLTSGNFTINSVNMLNSGNATAWSADSNARITISGHTKKLILAGTFKYQLYESGVTSFIASGNSPYFMCDNKGCDTSSPIALQWINPRSRPLQNNFKLTMSIALPPKSSSSSEFKLVLWGEDQDHFPYDFTTTVNFKYGGEVAAVVAAVADKDNESSITSEPKSCKKELKKLCGKCGINKKCWLSCAKSNEADLIAHGCTKPSVVANDEEADVPLGSPLVLQEAKGASVVGAPEIHRSWPHKLKCNVCKKAVGWAVGKGEKYGCGLVSKVAASAMCELIGLGPEDPAADICVAVVVTGCNPLLDLIERRLHGDQRICQLLPGHWC